MKTCTKCHESLPEDVFYRYPNGYLNTWCRPCVATYVRERRKASPELNAKALRVARLSRHGLTEETLTALWVEQGGACAACGDPVAMAGSDAYALDHDHACCPAVTSRRACGKCLRGILCGGCNRGLGQFRDDPAKLRAAADYLDRWAARGVVQ